MRIPDAALKTIEAAVQAAEQNTSGEIAVAVVAKSDGYGAPRAALALGAALLATAGALALGLPSFAVAAAWPLAGVAGFVVTLVPAVARAIIPEHELDAEVLESAKAAFLDNGVHRTADRAGVLVYLSLLEHRVIVLADTGIHAAVGEEGWKKHVAVIVESMRTGHPEALAAVVTDIGALLSQHFPARADDKNELPDAVRVG